MDEGAPAERAADAPRSEQTPGPVLATRRRALALGAGLIGAALAPALVQAREFVHPIALRATQIVVSKSNRVLELHSGAQIIGRYRIDLGFKPEGQKSASGDGRTPEGRYWIDRRNPLSEFHLSLGISYPNATDITRAHALGVDPGGDIFIHGEPVREAKRSRRDWTAGCIAVRNSEIEQIWALTPLGVPVTILA